MTSSVCGSEMDIVGIIETQKLETTAVLLPMDKFLGMSKSRLFIITDMFKRLYSHSV